MAQVPEDDDSKLTPPYARYLAPLVRPFPNFDLFWVKSLRQKAVQLLHLKTGGRVLDAGCGPGGSFPHLVDAVGPSGEVVGIEISPEMAINARNRIEKNHWRNVSVMESAADTVKLEGMFDGLLMLGAPDVYASPQALANLFPHLSNDAHVVAFGAKLSRNRLGRVLNPLFGSAFSKLTFASTPRLDHEPWLLLRDRVASLNVQEQFFGWMFLAWGATKRLPNE
jgi:SAM-dependent methyltransferase